MPTIAFDAKRAFHNRTGLGNYSRFLLSGLAAMDTPYRLLLMNPKPGELFAERSAKLEEIQPQGIYRLLTALWRSGGMWRELRDEQVDIYHGLSGELPSGLDKQKIASVVTIHDLIFESHPQFYKPVDRLIYRHKFRSAVRQASKVVSVSAYTKNELVRLYGVDENKIEVHYQSCHPAFRMSASTQADQEKLAHLALPDEYALSVGTIEERKNLLNVLKAIVSIPDLPLVVVGRGGAYAERCKLFAKENGLSNRIIWIEKIEPEELAALYRLAKVFLYPSKIEGFGIPIIEALFSRTPVITSAGGVFPEAGGPGSLYIDPDSPESIQDALERILGDEGFQISMKEDGLDHAHKHFLPENLIDGMLHLYEKLLPTPAS